MIQRAFAASNIGLLFTGLITTNQDFFGTLKFGSFENNLNTIILLVFLITLRAKFWYDDEQYFKDMEKVEKDKGFYFGYILGIFSWVIWCFASISIRNIQLSALFMSIVIFISFVWIVVTLIKEGAYREQVPWLFFNFLYISCFLLLAFRDKINIFSMNVNAFSSFVLIVMFIILLFDISVTRILEEKRTKEESNK